MRIELVCTGDELVTGLTVDTNSSFLEARLFDRGEKVQRVVVVGDVRSDITAAILDAAARSDVVVVCGGLGPTSDDFTVECAAEAAGVPLVTDERVLVAMRERFRRRNIEFTENNLRQARVPAGAEVVGNPVGSAPLFIVQYGSARAFFLPGVPREFKTLVDQEVLPRLDPLIRAQPGRLFRAFRLLKTMGIPESHLDARVAPIAAEHPKVVFGFRTHAPENHLKLMSEATTEEEAQQALAAAEAACRSELGEAIFGADEERFPEALQRLLLARRETLAIAESCTGGLVASMVTSVPGASDVLIGSAVVYTEAMKTEWAGVSPALLSEKGAVSREVAEALAQGIRARTGADWGLGITGYAGPTGGNERDPVGTVYFGIARAGDVRCERHVFVGDRERVRRFGAAYALDLLRRTVLRESTTR